MFLYSMLLYKIFKLHLLTSYELKKRKWRYLFAPMHEGCAGVGRQGMCLIGLYLHGVGVELNILMTFPQALRVVEITVFLKQEVVCFCSVIALSLSMGCCC